MTDDQHKLGWRGQQLIDPAGQKIGQIEEVYLDAHTDRPEWAAVKTGLLGNRLNLVPLADASHDGEGVRVSYSKATIKDAPHIDAGRELSPDEEDALYHYYRRDRPDDEQTGGSREQGTQELKEGAANIGAAIGEAARDVGRAAIHEAARHDRPTDQQTESRESAPTRPGETTSTERREPGDTEAAGGSDRPAGRLRRHVVTEHLSETGEVTRRETHTEEGPDPDERRQ